MNSKNRDAKASCYTYPEHFEKRGAVGVGGTVVAAEVQSAGVEVVDAVFTR